jgi:DNA-binding transcriptional MerR regulator
MHNNSNHNEKLPDKLYFKIGEVSAIAGVPSYVLRFWETEFKKIRPKRTESGQRLYRKEDVELVLKIKHLLYVEKFTIDGARQYLASLRKQKSKTPSSHTLDEIRMELESIRAILSE